MIAARHPPSHRRAFTLLELVVYLGVFSAFVIAAMPLFRATLRSWRDCDRQQADEMRFDLAVEQLRRDVWSAKNVSSPDPRILRVENSDGQTVAWRADPAGDALSRVAPGATNSRRWLSLGGMTFAAHGVSVTVRMELSPPSADVVLVSPTMLAQGRSR